MGLVSLPSPLHAVGADGGGSRVALGPGWHHLMLSPPPGHAAPNPAPALQWPLVWEAPGHGH